MHLTALVSVSVSLSYGLINISDRKKHIVVDEFTAWTLPWSGVKTKVPHVSSKSRLVVCNFMACWTSMWQSDKSYRVLLYLQSFDGLCTGLLATVPGADRRIATEQSDDIIHVVDVRPAAAADVEASLRYSSCRGSASDTDRCQGRRHRRPVTHLPLHVLVNPLTPTVAIWVQLL